MWEHGEALLARGQYVWGDGGWVGHVLSLPPHPPEM